MSDRLVNANKLFKRLLGNTMRKKIPLLLICLLTPFQLLNAANADGKHSGHGAAFAAASVAGADHGAVRLDKSNKTDQLNKPGRPDVPGKPYMPGKPDFPDMPGNASPS